MGTADHRGWARRWVAGALGGALLLGVLGARAVPPPPPLLWTDPARRSEAPPGPEPPGALAPGGQAGGRPGVGPALIWLFPMAGQLSSPPGAGE
ncbi:MAG TPA: hypothetical protein VIG99_13685 [Myxococcaceae bacterium]|jgi:hypothetical protein